MKIKSLFILAVLVPLNCVFADNMPDGCYVANYYRTDPCWEASNDVTGWISYANRNVGVFHYGNAVESIIYSGSQDKISFNNCVDNYATLADKFNNLSNAADSNYSLLQQWIAYGQSQASLAKKLRRACGIKCKKIK